VNHFVTLSAAAIELGVGRAAKTARRSCSDDLLGNCFLLAMPDKFREENYAAEIPGNQSVVIPGAMPQKDESRARMPGTVVSELPTLTLEQSGFGTA
jgi:hypothetical protein